MDGSCLPNAFSEDELPDERVSQSISKDSARRHASSRFSDEPQAAGATVSAATGLAEARAGVRPGNKRAELTMNVSSDAT